MSDTYTERFPAELDKLDNVLDFVTVHLEDAGCPMKSITSISICLEELFVNVASYAYPGTSGDVTLSLDIDAEERVTFIKLSDSGIPFNPLAKEDPDVSLDAEKRKIGGLGIFMVKKMMDSVEYERIGGENIVSIKKSF